MRIKVPETSIVIVFMRNINIMKWPYYIVPSVQLIYGIDYTFLIFTWTRTVIFHSRRLVTKNMFSFFFFFVFVSRKYENVLHSTCCCLSMDIESPSYKTCTVSAVRTFTQTADVSLN